MWQAIRTACGLFHDTANDVGAQLGFSYPQADEDGFFQYLAFIQRTLTHATPGGKLSSSVEKKACFGYNQTELGGRYAYEYSA